MTEELKKKCVNKGLIALAVLGVIFLLKIIFRKRGEEKRGYYEDLGTKIDHGLENMASKAEELVHPKSST